jgi:formylglycine-generating enzyme required for sulfatase activity
VTIDEWREELAQRNEVFGRPAGYWCYVRPGTYRIGGWEKKKKGWLKSLFGGKEQEGQEEWEPHADIALPGFWVAKYPVTVRQYREFMRAGGYEREEWWTPEGWKWKESQGHTRPNYWGDKRFSSDDQPVVGVTWYEAAAFAAWLNHHLASDLPPGSAIRLPTEAEWEVAAGYDGAGQRRTYPWGEEEPTRTLADFNDGSNPDRPTPVGERTAGAAACGAQDMAGSVWEWTSSGYRAYPTESGTLVNDVSPDSGDAPVRGGSFFHKRTYVRCGSRDWNYPFFRYDYRGFRLFLPSNVRSGF